jgi:DegV family protein with EDD domain
MVTHFESFLEQGKDILALSISGNMSATYKLMLRAKETAAQKYPGRKIFIIDSRRVSASLGLLTVKACSLRAEGYTIEKTAETLEKIKNTVHQMGTLDDLFWVASKGRISNSKAFFGTLAGIKVMGDYNSDGMPTPIAKISGYKKAFKATLEYIKRTIKSADTQTVFVAYSARKTQAETFAALVKEQIKPKEISIVPVQQLSGINLGPGLVAAYYFGTEITDLKYERDTISDIIANKL